MAAGVGPCAQAGIIVVAALACSFGIYVGPEALPKFDETITHYGSRLFIHGRGAVDDLYVRVLLAMPGAVRASVSDRRDGSAEILDGSHDLPNERRVRDQNKLKQTVAKNEDEIDAQQKVSAKRLAEINRERAAAGDAEPLLVLSEQPDDIRSRMTPIDPAGPEMRCGQEISTESSLTTRNVELRVKSEYQGKHGKSHTWKYVITMTNHGKETVQMLTRHWVFVDGKGRLESEVKGPGARGVTPVLPPGGEWSYESGTSLSTSTGSMHGSFQFEVLKGDRSPTMRSFSGRVGRLLLSTKRDDTRHVPCVADSAGAVIPLTSVFSVERVIIGGRADAVGKTKVKGAPMYVFRYDVQINNARATDVRVVGHSWTVVDAKGKRTTTSGAGVGGSYKTHARDVAGGDAFRAQGELLSATKLANAEGIYTVQIKAEDGTFQEIEARTDMMGLSADPAVTHVPEYAVATVSSSPGGGLDL